MLPKSANYSTIWADPAHYAETKIVCGADTYTENDIMSLNRTQTLFADYYDIGNTVMNQIQFSLIGATPTDIPRLSRVEVWTRLWSGDGTDSTDWLPMGVYYTGKPDYDTEAQLLSVVGYDEMYKTGVVPFESGATVTTWDNPSLRAVAKHIVEGGTQSQWISLYDPTANPLEAGSIDSSGADTANSNTFRTVGYIAVEPDTQYKVTSNYPNTTTLVQYETTDSSSFIRRSTSASGYWTTKPNTHYVRITVSSGQSGVVPVVEGLDIGTTETYIDTNFAGIGLELEDSTQVLDTITMPSIPFNYTVREILRDIAIACCGNWTMVFQEDSGSQKAVLRLVKCADWSSPVDVSLGRNVTSFEKGDEIPSATDVYVYYGYDSNGVALYQQATATPNDGREYEVEVKTITDGTQASLIASEILTGLGGSFYKPYSASGAELDPACELGDTVTVNSVTSVIGAISCDFNRGMWADISAEGLEPVDDFEFLSSSSNTAQRIERSAEVNSARISVNADQIQAEVERATSAEDDLNTNLRSTITHTATDITVTLQSYAQDQVNNHAVEQQQYIRYSADGLELGEAGTNSKAILTNTRLSFKDPSDDTKAYIGLAELYDPQANPIAQGNINSSGANASSTTRARTSGYIEVSPSTEYRITTNMYELGVFEYSGENSSNFIQTNGWQTSPYTFTTTSTTTYIRLSFRKQDTSETVVASDVSELSITATSGDYKFFVINGHIVNQLELGNNWLLVASGSDTDNRLTFKWRG